MNRTSDVSLPQTNKVPPSDNMAEPTKPEQSEEAARRAEFIEDFKKQHPGLDLDMEPDPNFLSGTREENMERMRQRVEKVAAYFKQDNPHAPIPGNSEPWWKTFIDFEADLRVGYTFVTLPTFGCAA